MSLMLCDYARLLPVSAQTPPRLRSLDEIGARFNISRERARQIEARAMQKLRRPAQTRQLRAYAT